MSKCALRSKYTLQLSLARTLARDAGRIIRESSAGTSSQDTTTKSTTSDLVTSTDLAVQSFIFDSLRATYPDDVLIGEEDGEGNRELTAASTWIVDPVDGTTNFCHKLPDVAVSIGYAVDKKVVVGVLYNPFRDEEYYAVKGYGSWCNGEKLKTSGTSKLEESVIVTEFGYERSEQGVNRMLGAVKALMLENVRALKMYGSGTLDLAYVAKGVIDGCYGGVATEGWKMWDYAAGGLIAEEAGAEIVTLCGDEFYLTSPNFLCCTKELRDKLLDVINKSQGAEEDRTSK